MAQQKYRTGNANPAFELGSVTSQPQQMTGSPSGVGIFVRPPTIAQNYLPGLEFLSILDKINVREVNMRGGVLSGCVHKYHISNPSGQLLCLAGEGVFLL